MDYYRRPKNFRCMGQKMDLSYTFYNRTTDKTKGKIMKISIKSCLLVGMAFMATEVSAMSIGVYNATNCTIWVSLYRARSGQQIRAPKRVTTRDYAIFTAIPKFNNGKTI
jgi:hypothetical protein